MRNLVTGGAGFIGSHLINSLIDSGEEVICIDNLSTGDKENISKWGNSPQFNFVLHDVVKPLKINVDRIWHLACPASTLHYQNDPIKTSLTNFMGTLNMLELAKNLDVEILFTSTSEIYGDSSSKLQLESNFGSINPIGIRSCYGEGKRMAECLCLDYQRCFDTKVRIARIFNVYGPGMVKNDGRLINNLINQALEKKPLTIFGDGDQSRCFCFIDDLIVGLKKLMDSNYEYPVNFGNPKEDYTILEIAKLILSKTNSSSELINLPLPQDDPFKRKPSIELANILLNWQPVIDINEGLKKTITHIEGKLND